MQICLIIPPSGFLLDERVFPSLGILKIAAILEQHHQVTVLDLSGRSHYRSEFESYAESHQPEWFGITTTTPQLPAVVQIIQVIKSLWPKVPIYLGGPHVTLINAARKLEKVPGRAHQAWQDLVDLNVGLVSGDGDNAVTIALSGQLEHIDADSRASLLFLTDQQYDTNPFPARHLIDMESYRYQIDGYKATSIISQLGCPFNCGFCGGRNSASLRITRRRSVASIIEEIRSLYTTYGYRGFMFYDDELNIQKRQLIALMRALCDLQEQLGVDLRFRGFVKAELFSQDQAEAMYQAGFRWLLCGFESAHPRILHNIDKRATCEDNDQMLELARNAGIKVKALMSVGHPGESWQTVETTQEWLIKRAVDDFDCSLITVYPGTNYYDRAVKHDLLANTYVYSHPDTQDKLYSLNVDFTRTTSYYKGIPGHYDSYVYTDYLTALDLIRVRDQLEDMVRQRLNLAYPQVAVKNFEQSMGQRS